MKHITDFLRVHFAGLETAGEGDKWAEHWLNSGDANYYAHTKLWIQKIDPPSSESGGGFTRNQHQKSCGTNNERYDEKVNKTCQLCKKKPTRQRRHDTWQLSAEEQLRMPPPQIYTGPQEQLVLGLL